MNKWKLSSKFSSKTTDKKINNNYENVFKIFAKKMIPLFGTFRLFNSYFFKTIYGPILAFIFPTLILAILGNVLKIEYVLPGIIAMSSMFIAVQAMPLGIMEMKNSTLFKYIGASPMNSKQFSLIVIIYYIFVDFFAIFIIIFMTAAIFPHKVFPLYKSDSLFSGILTAFGAFSFLSANLFHMALGLAIGITIATLSKTPQQALTIGLIIIIPSMFLSGMVITVDIIAQSDVMQWISRFIPFRYTTGNIIVSSTPLDQLGDFYHLLSRADKQLLFNDTLIDKYDKNDWTSLNILNAYKADPDYYKPDIKDQPLFELLFVKNSESILAASDNNMFNLLSEFGVRKIPDISKIQSFLQEYLHDSAVHGFGNVAGELADRIRTGDFSWMGLFTNQTMKLYTVPERSLNLFLPIIISFTLLFISYKKFRWSSR